MSPDRQHPKLSHGAVLNRNTRYQTSAAKPQDHSREHSKTPNNQRTSFLFQHQKAQLKSAPADRLDPNCVPRVRGEIFVENGERKDGSLLFADMEEIIDA